MGTSGSFKGSGGKDAGSLRDAIADWLDSSGQSDDGSEEENTSGGKPVDKAPLSPSAIAPAIRLWHSGPSGGSGGSRTSGGSTERTETPKGGRSSGGARRVVARVAGPAGRASALARAYSTADRDALQAAGLDYGELRALNDPLEVGRRIAAVAFEAQPDGSIEDSESRLIVAQLVSWVLEAPEDQPLEPDEIARHSIELMIAQATLVEVGDTIRKEKDPSKRHAVEEDIRQAAHVIAAQTTLGGASLQPKDIASQIDRGVTQLKEIYGDAE